MAGPAGPADAGREAALLSYSLGSLRQRYHISAIEHTRGQRNHSPLDYGLGERVERDSLPLPLYVFPTAENFQEATDGTLRATGLSASKVGTLRRVAEKLLSGALKAKKLEEVSSQDATAALCRIKGIGPWTAAIILLRGWAGSMCFPRTTAAS